MCIRDRVHAERKIIDNIFKDDTQQADTLIGQFFAMEDMEEDRSVSYTHLDVYKRQCQ